MDFTTPCTHILTTMGFQPLLLKLSLPSSHLFSVYFIDIGPKRAFGLTESSLYDIQFLFKSSRFIKHRSNTSNLSSSHISAAFRFARCVSGTVSNHFCSATTSATLNAPSALTSPFTETLSIGTNVMPYFSA